MPELVCERCGHTEDWEHGNYFGEREDFSHQNYMPPEDRRQEGETLDAWFRRTRDRHH
jgi:hypothetical protein